MCPTFEDAAGLAGKGGVIGEDTMGVCNLRTLSHDQTRNWVRSFLWSASMLEREYIGDSYARKCIPAARQLFEIRAACLLFKHIWRA